MTQADAYRFLKIFIVVLLIKCCMYIHYKNYHLATNVYDWKQQNTTDFNCIYCKLLKRFSLWHFIDNYVKWSICLYIYYISLYFHFITSHYTLMFT